MSSLKKDLLTLLDYTPDEIRGLILLSEELKQKRLCADPKVLAGKSGVLIFEKPSLRTRITFETAINELGGHAINLASEMIGMGKRETVEDVARNLERWVHLIVARTYAHQTLVKLAGHCRIPVINALSDMFHPCQALAFALTLHEHQKQTRKHKVVFIGDGNNVCNSLMVLSAKLGYDFAVVGPAGYEPRIDVCERCVEIGKQTGSSIRVCHDPLNVISDATVIYTDVWTSMGQEKEVQKRQNDFARYQLNEQLLSRAPSDALVSHCLPAHRGEEITSEVLDSKQSIAFDEAENRLHAQKAVIVHLFS